MQVLMIRQTARKFRQGVCKMFAKRGTNPEKRKQVESMMVLRMSYKLRIRKSIVTAERIISLAI